VKIGTLGGWGRRRRARPGVGLPGEAGLRRGRPGAGRSVGGACYWQRRGCGGGGTMVGRAGEGGVITALGRR
jgi:hypothetical protein